MLKRFFLHLLTSYGEDVTQLFFLFLQTSVHPEIIGVPIEVPPFGVGDYVTKILELLFSV